MLSESACAKAARKYVGEIYPSILRYLSTVSKAPGPVKKVQYKWYITL